MSWSELSDDLFEVLVLKLDRSQLKSLHLVSHRFCALVKWYSTHLSPRYFHLSIPHAFPNVTDLDLSRCWNQVNDLQLTALSKIYSRTERVLLRSLNLAKCHGVTNRGITGVSQNLSMLEDLNLEGCRSSVPTSYVGYTGVNGKTLDGLMRLKRLNLRWNPVTDSSFKTVTKLTHLTHLDLGECHGMSETSIASLRCFQMMEVLNLERTMISPGNIDALTEMPFLTTLSLRNCSEINDAALLLLTQLSQLKELNLGKLNNVTDDGVCYLIMLPGLQVLDLTYCVRLSGNWIRGCPLNEGEWQLRRLNLADCCNWVTNDILHELSIKMPHLGDIVLKNCVRITDSGLGALRPLRNLDLSRCCCITNKALDVLSSMRGLVELNLAFCAHVTDEGLEKLRKLTCLEVLVLNCCPRITAAGIRSLKPLRESVRRLEISACHGIEADSLFFISNWFSQLEVLNVSWLALHDTQFRSLKNLRHLSQVEIRGCHELSDDMLKDFWYLAGITDAQILG